VIVDVFVESIVNKSNRGPDIENRIENIKKKNRPIRMMHLASKPADLVSYKNTGRVSKRIS